MSEALICDNCGDTVRYSEDGNEHSSWLALGWIDIGLDHACSIDCAVALLEAMRKATE